MASKSLFITYVLWFFGGFFGLHHFYLNRDYHGLLWWMFLGGYFGAGWLRDLWRIPEYVKDANEDPEYMQQLSQKMSQNEKPEIGSVRYFGQLLVSDSFGYLVIRSIPREMVDERVFQVITALFVPLANALGVYLVGNIGRHEGKLRPALTAAYLTSPLYFFMDSPTFLSSLFSNYVFNSYCVKWRRTPRPKVSLTRRTAFVIACLTLYFSLWGSWFYFNCTLTYQNEEEVKCRDAAKHFFKSPIWKQFGIVMKELWDVITTHGLFSVWEAIVEAFDPVGERHALQILGLDSTASQQEITSRYRKLSREWHPDKHKGEAAKNEAQEKFIEIQQAYEILSHIKSQRLAQNTKQHEEL